jgi:hypothetical protein
MPMLRGVSALRPAVLAILALLTAAGPAAAAGDPIMPLSQVQRGMQCTGYTVIRGTEISSFAAVVDDVVYDAVNSATILITISGPAVDDTGAGPGFSGSPIYCPSPADGTPQVIGALSFGIGDYDNKTVLVTPIEKMLGEPVTPPSSARRATARERRARPLGAPLSIAGLAPAVAEVFQRAASRAGRIVYAAPAGSRVTSFPTQTLRPGSAVAVGYSSGDVALGGIGTVTYVDGDSIWAFGHPLESVGRRSLFLEDAYVYGVISSPSIGGAQSTYKFAAPGHDIGTLTGDGAFSVTGITGALPPHFPLTVTATDEDRQTTQTLRVELADERQIGNPTGFSPLGFVGTSTLAQAAYSTLHGSPLNTSGDMCVSFRVAERAKPLGFCNTYVATGTGLASDGAGSLMGAAPVLDFGTAAQTLDSYRLGALTLTGVNVTLNLRRGLSQAFVTRIAGPKKITRGKDYRVRMYFKRPGGGKEQSVSIPVHAPIGMTRGKRDLVLTGTPSDLAGGGFSAMLAELFGGSGFSDEAGPKSLAVLSKQIGAIHRYDGVTASFRPRHGKDPLGSPTTPDALPSGAAGRALRERPVFRSPKLRYSGAASIAVVVR